MTRERRWIVLVEDGRLGATLGRHADPSEQEILTAEAALLDRGLSGWLVVTEGIYYSDDLMTLLQVRELGKPTVGWDHAAAAFLEERRQQTTG